MMKDRFRAAGIAASLSGVALAAAWAAAARGQTARPAGTPDYAPVIRALEGFVEQERVDKQLPAISIALVDGATLVWSRGFGMADPAAKAPADGRTVYRLGSMTQLFADVAVMQQVERGALDLDAPVTEYLPQFHPTSRFRGSITLRELMTHRSGLVREPPVGHVADASSPTLAATIESLNQTELVYAPGTHTKYSDAGAAVVGAVLEKVARQPFASLVSASVLRPIGMTGSGFPAPGAARPSAAKGFLWTYDGRTFDAPVFPLGAAPAGNLDSTVVDLARFLSVLFAGGQAESGPVLTRASLEKMWSPQYAAAGERAGGGLGFRVGQLQNRRVVACGGGIWGFSAEIAALPDERLGVAVAASLDATQAVTGRIAGEALPLLLAARHGRPLPPLTRTSPLAPDFPQKLAGHFGRGDEAVELIARGGELYEQFAAGGYRARLRRLDNALVADDRLAFGGRLEPHGPHLHVGGRELARVVARKPAPPPARWKGLIGEYGPDFAVLYVLEKDGKLQALADWFEYDPLAPVSSDVFRFPDRGLYDHETLTFTRGAGDRSTAVRLGGVRLERRAVGPEEGRPFQIHPVRPVDELRKEALAAAPPKQAADLRSPELVELAPLDPKIRLDVRYAKKTNFLGTPLYSQERAFLQRPAAEALVRAEKRLEKLGYGLLIHDAYRPWYVTKMFWDATPEKDHIFVADPATGSRHNRGCAVDLTLYDLKTGRPVEMPGTYDEMSPRSYPDYPGGTSLQRGQRDLLRWAMESEGFTVYQYEWWHYDYKDWNKYPVMNLRFEELGR
jgi:CubicO group peptidase (beta-lactamase class C family)/D-alanyl-D-alanine dipeptidase